MWILSGKQLFRHVGGRWNPSPHPSSWHLGCNADWQWACSLVRCSTLHSTILFLSFLSSFLSLSFLSLLLFISLSLFPSHSLYLTHTPSTALRRNYTIVSWHMQPNSTTINQRRMKFLISSCHVCDSTSLTLNSSSTRKSCHATH